MILDFEDRIPSATSWRMKFAFAAYAMLSIYGVGSAFASEPDPPPSPTANADTFRVSPEDVKSNSTDKTQDEFKGIFDNFGDDEGSENSEAKDEPVFDPKPYWKGQGEGVRVIKSGCDWIRSYDDGSFLSIELNPTTDTAILGFSVPEGTSLKAFEKRNISFYFGKVGGRKQRYWEDIEATVIIGNSPVLFMYLNGNELVADFAKHTAIQFETEKDVIIALYSLKGTRLAMRHLRECAFKQAGLNINDPFLK